MPIGQHRSVRPVVEAETDLGPTGLVAKLAQQDERGTALRGKGGSVGPSQHDALAGQNPLRGGADPAAPDRLHLGDREHRLEPLAGPVGQWRERRFGPRRRNGDPVTRRGGGSTRGGDRGQP
jgi:hypothetical protein